MNYAKIIEQLQQSIFSAQQVLKELQCIDDMSSTDIYITRQEAADLLGKGLRQMDRDCKRYGIKRKSCNNGVRISKRDILVHIGAISATVETTMQSDFERIISKGMMR